jgi:hypothetical protein
LWSSHKYLHRGNDSEARNAAFNRLKESIKYLLLYDFIDRWHRLMSVSC